MTKFRAICIHLHALGYLNEDSASIAGSKVKITEDLR